MKRIFLLICLTMFLTASVAQATMTEYQNPSFNFDKVKNILLLDTKQDATRRSTVTNDFAFQQIDQMLAEALERRGVNFTYASKALLDFNVSSAKSYDFLVAENGQAEADNQFYAWASTYYDVYLSPILLNYNTPTHRVPSYVTSRTIIDKVRIYDNKGNYTIVETPRTIYETVPERYYKSSDIAIRFAAISLADQKEIFLLKDQRSRDGNDAFDGMMKRICENLAKKLYEKMPNARTK